MFNSLKASIYSIYKKSLKEKLQNFLNFNFVLNKVEIYICKYWQIGKRILSQLMHATSGKPVGSTPPAQSVSCQILLFYYYAKNAHKSK